MSVQFSGWEVIDDSASFPGMELEPAQRPQNRGVYTMYHGTSIANARTIIVNGFKQSTTGMLGRGVYVSRDIKKAAHYPLNSNVADRVVFQLRVRVGRVKRIDVDNHPMQYTWHTNGYDTAWVPPDIGLKAVPSGLEEDCVFDPRRVKVVGIAKAPNIHIQKELQQLLAKTAGRGGNSGWEVTYDDSPRVALGASQKPEDRKVYVMYHGTSVANAKLIIANGFQQSQSGMLGKSVYLTRNKKKAERYPLHSDPSDRVVLELHVRVGRVKCIDKDNHPMQYTWSTQGYDTAWVPPSCGMKAVPSGLEEDCVFDPTRVKVVGIAKAPDAVFADLKQLVANSLRGGGGDGGAVDVCSLCRRKTPQGSPHIRQQCWGCGQNICILMTKHFCPAKP